MADTSTAVTIKVKDKGGAELPNASVIAVSVTYMANAVPSARLTLKDGDVATREFVRSNDANFQPGAELSIELGSGTETTPVFKGIIVRQQLMAGQGGKTHIVLELKDLSVKMTHIRKARNFLDQKDNEILETLIGDHGLTAKVDSDFETQHEKMVQYQASDWDFMVMRAEAGGKVVLVNMDEIVVTKPEIKETGDSPKTTYGDNVFEAELEIESRDQYAAGAATAWDHASQELVEDPASDPGASAESGSLTGSEVGATLGEAEFKLRHTGELPDTELTAWSTATLQRSRLSKVRGRLKLKGDATYVPGITAVLDGFSDPFNGAAYVSGVQHDVANGIWFSNLEIGLPFELHVQQQQFVVEPPAGGLLPPMRGLYIGTVKEIADDPQGFFRVLVKIPVIDDAEDGIWCRVAHPDAGASHTVFFQPDIADEVVVGFLQEDPRFGIVLGSLHNSGDNAPAIDDNDDYLKKGIVTKEGLKLTFNDKDKIILLETPAGKKITADEKEGVILLEDENGNKVELSSDGITIESAGDINIKATGDINIEGMNISQAANAQFKAEGSAGIEVSSSAIAVLKGSLVQIN
jgi:Rhs element Vgr protein